MLPRQLLSSSRRTVLAAASLILAACSGSSTASDTTAAAAAPAGSAASSTSDAPTKAMPSVYSLRANSLAGQPVELSTYKGKVTLVVNVASECGYTPQYTGLQKLHDELSARGFAVLGFPSNEFGNQEPGTPDQIQQFCSSKFGVTFPLFAKVETKAGERQSPVYAALNGATGRLPNWNFCKYLVGKDGSVIGFYPSKVAPDDQELRAAIEKALQ